MFKSNFEESINDFISEKKNVETSSMISSNKNIKYKYSIFKYNNLKDALEDNKFSEYNLNNNIYSDSDKNKILTLLDKYNSSVSNIKKGGNYRRSRDLIKFYNNTKKESIGPYLIYKNDKNKYYVIERLTEYEIRYVKNLNLGKKKADVYFEKYEYDDLKIENAQVIKITNPNINLVINDDGNIIGSIKIRNTILNDDNYKLVYKLTEDTNDELLKSINELVEFEIKKSDKQIRTIDDAIKYNNNKFESNKDLTYFNKIFRKIKNRYNFEKKDLNQEINIETINNIMEKKMEKLEYDIPTNITSFNDNVLTFTKKKYAKQTLNSGYRYQIEGNTEIKLDEYEDTHKGNLEGAYFKFNIVNQCQITINSTNLKYKKINYNKLTLDCVEKSNLFIIYNDVCYIYLDKEPTIVSVDSNTISPTEQPKDFKQNNERYINFGASVPSSSEIVGASVSGSVSGVDGTGSADGDDDGDGGGVDGDGDGVDGDGAVGVKTVYDLSDYRKLVEEYVNLTGGAIDQNQAFKNSNNLLIEKGKGKGKGFKSTTNQIKDTDIYKRNKDEICPEKKHNNNSTIEFIKIKDETHFLFEEGDGSIFALKYTNCLLLNPANIATRCGNVYDDINFNEEYNYEENMGTCSDLATYLYSLTHYYLDDALGRCCITTNTFKYFKTTKKLNPDNAKKFLPFKEDKKINVLSISSLDTNLLEGDIVSADIFHNLYFNVMIQYWMLAIHSVLSCKRKILIAVMPNYNKSGNDESKNKLAAIASIALCVAIHIMPKITIIFYRQSKEVKILENIYKKYEKIKNKSIFKIVAELNKVNTNFTTNVTIDYFYDDKYKPLLKSKLKDYISEKKSLIEKSIFKFIKAQSIGYVDDKVNFQTAFNELVTYQKKQKHYIWYVLPQSLGFSNKPISKYYSITSKSEFISFIGNTYLSDNYFVYIKTLFDLINKDKTCEYIFDNNNVDVNKLISSLVFAISLKSKFRIMKDKFTALISNLNSDYLFNNNNKKNTLDQIIYSIIVLNNNIFPLPHINISELDIPTLLEDLSKGGINFDHLKSCPVCYSVLPLNSDNTVCSICNYSISKHNVTINSKEYFERLELNQDGFKSKSDALVSPYAAKGGNETIHKFTWDWKKGSMEHNLLYYFANTYGFKKINNTDITDKNKEIDPESEVFKGIKDYEKDYYDYYFANDTSQRYSKNELALTRLIYRIGYEHSNDYLTNKTKEEDKMTIMKFKDMTKFQLLKNFTGEPHKYNEKYKITPEYFNEVIKLDNDKYIDLNSLITVKTGYYKYEEEKDDEVNYWVNFANQKLGGGIFEVGNVMEEILNKMCPELVNYALHNCYKNVNSNSKQSDIGNRNRYSRKITRAGDYKINRYTQEMVDYIPSGGTLKIYERGYNQLTETAVYGYPTPILFTNVSKTMDYSNEPEYYGHKLYNHPNLIGKSEEEQNKYLISNVLKLYKKEDIKLINILAIASPKSWTRNMNFTISLDTVSDILNTFKAGCELIREAEKNNYKKIRIHSGFLGCGAFNQNHQVVLTIHIIVVWLLNTENPTKTIYLDFYDIDTMTKYSKYKQDQYKDNVKNIKNLSLYIISKFKEFVNDPTFNFSNNKSNLICLSRYYMFQYFKYIEQDNKAKPNSFDDDKTKLDLLLRSKDDITEKIRYFNKTSP